MEIDACWNRVGVWARVEQRCPELERVIHCRNCAVYSRAGRDILEQEFPENYRQEWTGVLARESRQPRRKDVVSALVFRLGEEWFALASRLIDEVTRMRPIHRLPHLDNRVVKGLVNIRGEMKICVSLGEMLGLEKGVVSNSDAPLVFDRIIIARHEGGQFVFPVSEVHGIHHYQSDDPGRVPATVARATATYTTGLLEWEGRHVACLDHELLFYALNKKLQ